MHSKKKALILIISILLIIDISFVIYLSNFNSIAFDENFYKKEFRKYNVYNNLKDYDIEEINSDVLNYLKTEKEEKLIENDFFNQREKRHLLDVKNVIQKTIKLYYFLITLFLVLSISLIFLLNENIRIIKYLGIIFSVAGFLTILGAFIFFILINSNFSYSFDFFHNIFFKEGTYLFDPVNENIVNLYPPELFFDITQRIAINTLIFSSLLFIIGVLFLVLVKYKSRRNKKIYKKT